MESFAFVSDCIKRAEEYYAFHVRLIKLGKFSCDTRYKAKIIRSIQMAQDELQYIKNKIKNDNI